MQLCSHCGRGLCALLAIAVLMTAGCGQKGDLYLPDEPQALVPGTAR